ncbi:hypothetical protein Aduo_004644 [Ancylostoma duodenale]
MAGRFQVGSDEPAEYVNVTMAQIVLLSSINKAKLDSYRLVRKISRPELLGVGKPSRKNVAELCQELLTKYRPPTSSTIPSSSKTNVNESTAPKNKKSKTKSSNSHDSRTVTLSPGYAYAHLAKPCQHCGCKRVRVVNPGRLDRRNIMECTNRECIATIKFTNIPEGTLINPGGKPEEFSWYDLDPEEIFYPSTSTFARLEESLKSDVKKPFIPQIRYGEHGSIVVRCPGQKELVKMK